MQNNLALVEKVLQTAEIYYATITAVILESSTYKLLLADGSMVDGLKAQSCLVIPETDDLVLVSSIAGDNQVFILHILSRSTRSQKLDLGENASLNATNLSISAQTKIMLEAPEVNLSGIRGSSTFLHSSVISNKLELKAKKASIIIHSVERVLHTLTEKLVNSFRRIEGIEQTKAQRINMQIDDRISIKSRHAAIITEEEVSIDGKKIHIG